MSRGRLPHFLLKMFKLTDKEQEEYDDAKCDEDLAQIIIKDAKKKGCKLRYKRYEQEENEWINVEKMTQEIYDMIKPARKTKNGN